MIAQKLRRSAVALLHTRTNTYYYKPFEALVLRMRNVRAYEQGKKVLEGPVKKTFKGFSFMNIALSQKEKNMARKLHV